MKNILIVEDNAFISDIAATKLTEHGYIVTIASDGFTAREKLSTDVIDVVLLDIKLPDTTGPELLKEIRESTVHKLTPVIIFSNEQNDTEKQQIKEMGVSGYFTKASTDYEELFECIDKL